VSDTPRAGSLRYAAAFVARGLLFAAVWWILAEGRVRSPLVAVVLILATAAVSFTVLEPGAWRLKARAFPRFALYFLRQSVLGGIDVARRALNPSLPLEPGFIAIDLSPSTPERRALLVTVVSLLPGTLAARLDGDRLLVHALDVQHPLAARLDELQLRVRDVLD
jgi:multicomponent Na+:H+ antiporter subunit E